MNELTIEDERVRKNIEAMAKTRYGKKIIKISLVFISK